MDTRDTLLKDDLDSRQDSDLVLSRETRLWILCLTQIPTRADLTRGILEHQLPTDLMRRGLRDTLRSLSCKRYSLRAWNAHA